MIDRPVSALVEVQGRFRVSGKTMTIHRVSMQTRNCEIGKMADLPPG
jgi:hypothetical protein